uniref:Uncharacterized protein n=1 Tax=Branchiostoma floridae TaxID=7739 RepID=C3YZW1_BRAFL|eukprot:XP_002598370.1 hypothetical protein BRAFLDRAFT_69727 [Branchiostoma floridae]
MEGSLQRLNAVLSQYQDRYLPVNEGSGEGGLFAPDDPPAQWLTDRSLLSPLLAEYDHVMQTQKEQLEQCRADQGRLKDRVEQLVTENNRSAPAGSYSTADPYGLVKL